VVDRHVRATACALAAVHRPWPVEVRCLDLVEEVGELARAVLVTEGRKGSAAPAEEVDEALCGVLVDVFALADHYHVDLDELYPRLLARLVSDHPGGAGGVGNGPGAGWKEGPR
jgi:NTP pyrophosphatase (non-canonical NTP hydrolase)